MYTSNCVKHSKNDTQSLALRRGHLENSANPTYPQEYTLRSQGR